MGRRKKTAIVEEVKKEVIETPVEEVVKKVEEPKEEIKVEEPKEEKSEMINIPPVPETVKEEKKEYNIRDIIRKYIVGEPIRIFEGNLVFNILNDLVDNKYNVIIGDLDIRKFVVNIPPLPKIVFGNLIINKDADIKKPIFLGGKVIKK